MTFERPPGDYALMHANGMSWVDVLKKHRVHVQADALRAARALREEQTALYSNALPDLHSDDQEADDE